MQDQAASRARPLLLSVLTVLEHDGDELRGLDDARLRAALRAIQQAKAEIVTALASLGPPRQRAE